MLSTLIVPQLEMLIPEEAAQKLHDEVNSGRFNLEYAKVYMRLSEIIEGDFFNQYIKTGNILMISEGRPGIDNTYKLSEGVLRIEIDKATYERAGVQGKSIPSHGRKHVKARFLIELDLRLPSMVRGKNAFDKATWAFKNVLNATVAWLFYDCKPLTEGPGPIAQHQPVLRQLEPEVKTLAEVVVPTLPYDLTGDDADTATETLEWLGLALMLSPRLQQSAKMDTYLSRYQAPELDAENASHHTQTLSRIRWHGLLPATFVYKLILAALKTSGDSWLAVTAAAFDSQNYTILFTHGQALVWEYAD